MGKYNKYERKRPEAKYRIHPIWTGIGCLMIIIVPIMAGAGAQQLVILAHAKGWPIGSLYGYLHLPETLYTLPYISALATYISGIPDFMALLLFFLLIVLLMFGVLSLGYALVYRMIGPPQYTSEDAPPSRTTVRRRSR